MTLKISISGIRGYVPESLTPEVCLDFAKAFGAWLEQEYPKKKNKKVVIGQDPRQTSDYIKGIAASGLAASGCQVIDIGICPTPTVGLMIKHLKADGGIVITASHNPLPWNGLKFMRNDGIFLNENQAKYLINLYNGKKFIKTLPKDITYFSQAVNLHIKKVLGQIKIKNKKLKVAIDCCNGAGSVAAVELLKQIGCIVCPINCDVTAPFPHDPEPVEKNLSDLMQAVKDQKADIGFALDSDADRLAIISEQGKAIGEELTLALAVKYVLRKNANLPRSKKMVFCNLSTTQAIDDITKEFGGISLRTKIGEVHVAEELKKRKGLIGGEGNGGVIYPKVGFNRDSLTGIAMIIAYLSDSGKKLSKLAAEIPAYYCIKNKIECPNQQTAQNYISKIKNKFDIKNMILIEGVKVVVDGGWVHVRASNTEPILRIIAEAKTKSQAQSLVDEVTI